MASSTLHDLLMLVAAIVLQLVFIVIIGAVLASGYYIYEAWVEQRERIDRHQERLDWQSERLDWQTEKLIGHLVMLDRHRRDMDLQWGRIDQLQRDIGLLSERMNGHVCRMDNLEHTLHGYLRRYYEHDHVLRHRHGNAQPGDEQQPLFHGLDGHDERDSDSYAESTLDTKVIRNNAAQRSREIAEAVDPRSYGISSRPSISSNDEGESLSGSTLCEVAEPPQSHLRGGYQDLADDYFGHWHYHDSDDPEPRLPHPHWVENGNVVVTTTTTTHSAPIATVTGPVPSTSVTVTAAAQPEPRNPRINLPSLATIQNAQATSQVSSGLASHDDDGILPENRINIPASCFQRAQIAQLTRDLQNVHIRRNERRAERQRAQDSAEAEASHATLLRTPLTPSERLVEDDEGSSCSVGLWSPPVEIRHENHESSSTTAAPQ